MTVHGGAATSRRSFLSVSASLVALGAAGGVLRPQVARAATLSEGGPLSTVSMAMHLHASFSEGTASMATHLAQAVATGVDVVWWTEHDWRMQRRDYLTEVGFDGTTETRTGQPTVTWSVSSSGSLSTYSGGFVTSPVSAADPGRAGALRVSVKSSGSALAARRYKPTATNTRLVGNLDGTRLLVDVLCLQSGNGAWGEVRLTTSYLPDLAGRTAGQYVLTYLVGGPQPDGSSKVSGRNATVYRSAPLGAWATLSFDPVADLNRLFPGADFRDSAACVLTFGAASSGRVASDVVFDYLRVERTRSSGDMPLQVQRELMDGYAVQYPDVLQLTGLEVSSTQPHMNTFGPVTIPVAGSPESTAPAAIAQAIQSAGGVASYNHPFGTTGPTRSTSQQDAYRRSVAKTLLGAAMYGSDVLEVGFPGGKAGMSADQYLSLWDTMSRNLLFTTGVGTSDDHSGRAWATQQWNHVTRVIADRSQDALLDALRQGRAWFGPPLGSVGSLDLLADDDTPMGGVTSSALTTRTVRVLTDAVPTGGGITVVRGVADAPGTAQPDPSVTRQWHSAAEVVDGVLTVDVDTSSPAFVRVEVSNSAGATVAWSNPLWFLRDSPDPVPEARTYTA